MDWHKVYGELHSVLNHPVDVEQDYKSVAILSQYLDYYRLIDGLYDELNGYYDMQLDEVSAHIDVHKYYAPVGDEACRLLGTAAAMLECENPFASEVAAKLARLEWYITEMRALKAGLNEELQRKRYDELKDRKMLDSAKAFSENMGLYYSAAIKLRKEILRLKAEENDKVVEIARFEQDT